MGLNHSPLGIHVLLHIPHARVLLHSPLGIPLSGAGQLPQRRFKAALRPQPHGGSRGRGVSRRGGQRRPCCGGGRSAAPSAAAGGILTRKTRHAAAAPCNAPSSDTSDLLQRLACTGQAGGISEGSCCMHMRTWHTAAGGGAWALTQLPLPRTPCMPGAGEAGGRRRCCGCPLRPAVAVDHSGRGGRAAAAAWGEDGALPTGRSLGKQEMGTPALAPLHVGTRGGAEGEKGTWCLPSIPPLTDSSPAFLRLCLLRQAGCSNQPSLGHPLRALSYCKGAD